MMDRLTFRFVEATGANPSDAGFGKIHVPVYWGSGRYGVNFWYSICRLRCRE